MGGVVQVSFISGLVKLPLGRKGPQSWAEETYSVNVSLCPAEMVFQVGLGSLALFGLMSLGKRWPFLCEAVENSIKWKWRDSLLCSPISSVTGLQTEEPRYPLVDCSLLPGQPQWVPTWLQAGKAASCTLTCEQPPWAYPLFLFVSLFLLSWSHLETGLKPVTVLPANTNIMWPPYHTPSLRGRSEWRCKLRALVTSTRQSSHFSSNASSWK